MQPTAPGRFITLEGGEGAGKSTQARLLAAWLTGQGVAAVTTREPGGSAGAEDIRGLLVNGAPGRWDPLAETLLHYAARREHVARLINPALEAGQWVICDRFFDSTLAYQGYGQGVDPAVITALRTLVLGAMRPDLTLVLDVEPQTRLARIAARPGADDRYERMNEDFHARVRTGFSAIAAAEPERCAIIPADGPPDAVAASIQNVIFEKLSLKP